MVNVGSSRTPPTELPELMDAPECDAEALADALDVLDRTARRFGGTRLVRRHLKRLLRGRAPGPITLLDVGAGGGTSSADLADWLRRQGWAPTLVLADLHALTLHLCRERVEPMLPTAAFVRLDGAALPFQRDSIDVIVCTTTFHHLETEDAARLIAEFDRVSRIGWAVTDLSRTRTAAYAVGLLASTVWRSHPLPRNDGPISVRRSFTPAEVRTLIREAGVRHAVVERWPVRWAARAASNAGPAG